MGLKLREVQIGQTAESAVGKPVEGKVVEASTKYSAAQVLAALEQAGLAFVSSRDPRQQ